MSYLADLGVDLSSIGRSLGDQALTATAQAAISSPAVTINRARLATLVDLGYTTLDTYQAARPAIFAGSLLTAVGTGYALWKRKKTPEAAALYSVTCAMSLALAWLTRPNALRAATPPPPAASPSSPVVQSALAWADARAAKLSATRPGWESAALSRLWGDIGSGTMAPAIRTLLTVNTR